MLLSQFLVANTKEAEINGSKSNNICIATSFGLAMGGSLLWLDALLLGGLTLLHPGCLAEAFSNGRPAMISAGVCLGPLQRHGLAESCQVQGIRIASGEGVNP